MQEAKVEVLPVEAGGALPVIEAELGEMIEIPAGGARVKLVRPDGLGEGEAVGWGSLALINAVLAQSKNRSGILWFFGSLFLGPIATLLIAVFDPLPKEETEGG